MNDTHPMDAWWSALARPAHVNVNPDPAWPYEDAS